MNPPSKTPNWLLKLSAMMLPLFVVGIAELTLRWAGFGYDLSLFVTDPQRPDYWVMNPHASKRYFITQENATVGNAEPFRKVKAEHTIRLFVLGESTTVGYPYLNNGSFHRWLHYRLLHTFPHYHFEIINVGLTAVNSHTVRGFAEEIVDYQPDAVLIYTGHNEYYGALGVGATQRFGSNLSLTRLILKLRDWRVVQAGYQVIEWVRRCFDGQQIDLRENLMKRMALKQQIAFESEDYWRGIEQFEKNMAATLDGLAKANVPVFIGNLVSNEKDLPPFVSDTVSTAQSAIEQYKLAQKALQKKDTVLAKNLFVKAKDLDLLRFRAPEVINHTIEKLASQYTNTHLVNIKKIFEDHSQNRILGSETLLEHVHPNLLGYALMAEAFTASMRQNAFISPQWPSVMPLDLMLSEMPITTVDSLKGMYEVQILKEGWPFNQPAPALSQRPKTFEQQLAGGLVVRQLSWAEATNRLFNYYRHQKEYHKALRVAEALMLEHSYNADFYEQAAQVAMLAQQPQKTQLYRQRAFVLAPSEALAKLLFTDFLKKDQPQQALPYLNYAAQQNPQWHDLHQKVQHVIEVQKVWQADTSSTDKCLQVAEAYLAFANSDAAEKYIHKALRHTPKHPQALQFQNLIQHYRSSN
ncbi:MAG: hypothetical protein ACK4GN_00520 [Runella sp.]